jgi:hypothetical protein
MNDHTNHIDASSSTHPLTPAPAHPLITPQARQPINIRPAVPGDRDFAFVDALQKQHSKMLGFMHRQTLENYIEAGDLLIAETPPPRAPDGRELPEVHGLPLGYCMGRDTYFKREDVGIIYQLVVGETQRRSLIGAMLVQAMFEKAAYGCRLFSCWCAQDLDANWFWQSIGFVPLAFRTGSSARGRERIHIFWQKRIREGDDGPGATPYWFPSHTSGGAIREDRLVIPIPPGTHWRDAKPMILPEIPGVDRFVEDESANTALPAGGEKGSAGEVEAKPKRNRRKRMRAEGAGTLMDTRNIAMGGLRFPVPEKDAAEAEGRDAKDETPRKAKKKRAQRRYHPQYVDAARELCARFLEEVQADVGQVDRLLATDGAKYNVRKAVEGGSDPDRMLVDERTAPADEIRLLDAA